LQLPHVLGQFLLDMLLWQQCTSEIQLSLVSLMKPLCCSTN
jgi:hypothetical protein